MKLLFVFGTRPEAIKLAPVISAFLTIVDFEVKICVTAQHREILDGTLNFFGIRPDYDLDIMKYNQNLFDITAQVLKKLQKVFDDFSPDVVIVQGDTTTACAGALAAFYNRTKVAHIEAGLRSHNKYAPYPEEMNRVLISHIADYHFAATERAKQNLLKEGIEKNVWVVGNTGIDALFHGLTIIKTQKHEEFFHFFNFLDSSKRIILVTGHRRESFGKPLENICHAMRDIANNFPDVEIVYPVHLNPNVRKPVMDILHGINNIHLLDPLDFPYFIWIMDKSYLLLTDSGGIQEEAPSLGKPVLVMREVTERIEGIEAGTARLVGTNKEKIVNEVSHLLSNRQEYEIMAKINNPYGDGKSSYRIIDIFQNYIMNQS
jgi:UDP-N-acetylglucosamine 2-epimerase (non-hydrolysing)